MNLKSDKEITWCPGCLNNGILTSANKAVGELIKEGYDEKEDFCTVTGIGCHGKMHDYTKLNGLYGIHGRVLPASIGIKLGNPELNVIGFAGDGDTFNEGMAHFIHASRYNADFTLVVHNNKIFALTTGQPTATTEQGFKAKSMPLGKPSKPINPIALALEAGATFVARSYALSVQKSSEILKKAIKHEGFAFVEMMQPCLIFNDAREYIKEHMYWMSGPHGFKKAIEKAREWDYNKEEDTKIPMGVFYQTEEKTYEDKWDQLEEPWWKKKRENKTEELFEGFK